MVIGLVLSLVNSLKRTLVHVAASGKGSERPLRFRKSRLSAGSFLVHLETNMTFARILHTQQYCALLNAWSLHMDSAGRAKKPPQPFRAVGA